MVIDVADIATVNTMLNAMRQEAVDVVATAVPVDALREQRIVDVRYVGQGHELRVEVPNKVLTRDDLTRLRQDFEAQYMRIYGMTLKDSSIETVTWSVTVSTPDEAVVASKPSPKAAAPQPTGRRTVYEPGLGRPVEMPVYWRFDLAPGAPVAGPAVIAEDETTTIVPAGFTAALNDLGYIVMESTAS